jgi:Zn-dependent protease with chaperone function
LSIIFVAGFLVDLTSGPAWWVIMGVWLGSGAATLHPQTEALVARHVYRLRDLNQIEHDRIGQVWYAVCSAAGVTPSAFRVWIYDGERITAPATSGHTIAVTTWSVYTLPAPMLRAVLAHELAHHLGTPPRWSVLVAWYSIPTRIAAVVIRRLMPVLRRFPLLKGLVMTFWVMVGAGLILHGLVFGFAWTHFLLFSPLAAPLTLGLTGQTAEAYADRQAADLGFGGELLEVFYGWQAQAARDGAEFKRARPTSPDPTIATRLKALEKHLGTNGGPGHFRTVPGRF